MSLGVVRSLGSARFSRSPADLEDFEQELVDQYALALARGGSGRQLVAADRAVLFEFVGFLARPVWTASPADADRFLVGLRHDRALAKSTVQGKAWTLAGSSSS